MKKISLATLREDKRKTNKDPDLVLQIARIDGMGISQKAKKYLKSIAMDKVVSIR